MVIYFKAYVLKGHSYNEYHIIKKHAVGPNHYRESYHYQCMFTWVFIEVFGSARASVFHTRQTINKPWILHFDMRYAAEELVKLTYFTASNRTQYIFWNVIYFISMQV